VGYQESNPLPPVNKISPLDWLPNELPQAGPPGLGDLTAGDGASRGLNPKGSSTNVPQPSNVQAPISDLGTDGKNGMAG
jgi:hypothetical protein